MRALIGRCLCAGIIVVMPLMAWASDSVEDFYKSKNITVVVGFSAGGGYDLNARALSRSLGNHIAGHPKIIVQNMPGAGSLTAINYLANVAQKDGSELAIFSRGAPFEPLMGNKQAQFDPRQFTWIGSPSRETNVVFTRTAASLHTLADLRGRDVVVATSGGGADTATFPLIMNAVLNTKLKIITGYPGANESLLAVDRGEADGIAGISWGYIKATRPSWLPEKKIEIQLQFGLTKAADLPDVPLVFDVVHDPADRQLLELFLARLAIAWPLAGPAAVPAERAAALRQAFAATMSDPDYKADLEKQSLEVNPVYADEINQILSHVYTASPEVIERARAIADAAR
jgi:tripartite-type tricarboxylate transporter receptor subunit TctC